MYTQRVNAPHRGSMSSKNINMLQLSIIADLAVLFDQVNELQSPTDIQNGSDTKITLYDSRSNISYTDNMKSLSEFVSTINNMEYPVEFNCLC